MIFGLIGCFIGFTICCFTPFHIQLQNKRPIAPFLGIYESNLPEHCFVKFKGYFVNDKNNAIYKISYLIKVNNILSNKTLRRLNLRSRHNDELKYCPIYGQIDNVFIDLFPGTDAFFEIAYKYTSRTPEIPVSLESISQQEFNTLYKLTKENVIFLSGHDRKINILKEDQKDVEQSYFYQFSGDDIPSIDRDILIIPNNIIDSKTGHPGFSFKIRETKNPEDTTNKMK